MKRFIIFSIFILTVSIPSFSQTERDLKLSIRSNTPTQSPSSQSRIMSTETFDKQQIRREQYRPRPHNFIPPPPPIWGGIGGWNHWYRWGAPMNFIDFYDWDFNDRWGYRRQARVFQRSDGRQDTIVSKKHKFRIGLNYSTKKELGGWLTYGRSAYLKLQFNSKIVNDKSVFYDNPQVNLYNATLVWNDQRLQNIFKSWSTYIGVGKEFKNFGANMSIGIGRDEENFQFFDEFYILSNNGNYSFRNYLNNFVSTSVGLTHDYKFLSFSADYDPIRKNFWIGAGFNF